MSAIFEVIQRKQTLKNNIKNVKKNNNIKKCEENNKLFKCNKGTQSQG